MKRRTVLLAGLGASVAIVATALNVTSRDDFAKQRASLRQAIRNRFPVIPLGIDASPELSIEVADGLSYSPGVFFSHDRQDLFAYFGGRATADRYPSGETCTRLINVHANNHAAWQICGTIEYIARGPHEIVLGARGDKLRLRMDGRVCAYQPPASLSSGSRYRIMVTPPDGDVHRFAVDMEAEARFFGAAGDIRAGALSPLRVVMAGDSFTEGTGASARYLGIGSLVGYGIGVQDFWASGLGGTGWIKANGDRDPLINRLQRDVIEPKPDVVIFAMGLNDEDRSPADVRTAAAAVLAKLRDRLPGALVYVVGPFNPIAPNQSEVRTEINNALRSAAAGRQGVSFVDCLQVEFDKETGGETHPNDNGHLSLSEHLLAAIYRDVGVEFPA